MTRRMTPLRFALVLALLAGCSPAVDQRPVDPTRQRLFALGRAYGESLAARKTPASLADLAPYLKEAGNPDELSTSPRDGQPFVILWGTRFTEPQPTVYIHEKTGAGGTRFVLMTDGAAYELSEEKFQQSPKVK